MTFQKHKPELIFLKSVVTLVTLCVLRDPSSPSKIWSQRSQSIHNGHDCTLEG